MKPFLGIMIIPSDNYYIVIRLLTTRIIVAKGFFIIIRIGSIRTLQPGIQGALDSAALRVGPELFAFGLAFGGLCVHLQIFSFFESFPLPKWKFFSFRLLHGLFAVGMLKLWKHFLPETSQAAFQLYTPLPQNFGGLSTSMAGGASLLLMCCAFLLVLSKENDCETGQAVIK